MGQLRLFDDNTTKIKVYKHQNGYMAALFDGWYIAYGPTIKQAIKNVIKRYEDEMNYYGN